MTDLGLTHHILIHPKKCACWGGIFVFWVKKGGGGLGGVGENCYICEITNFSILNNYAQQNYR